MSLWVSIVGTIDMPFKRDDLLKLLKFGETLGCKYGAISEGYFSSEVMATYVLDQASQDKFNYSFFVFFPEFTESLGIGFSNDGPGKTRIHFFGFKLIMERPRYYSMHGIDYIPFIKAFLKFVDPYLLMSFEVESIP